MEGGKLSSAYLLGAADWYSGFAEFSWVSAGEGGDRIDWIRIGVLIVTVRSAWQQTVTT